MKKVIAKVDRPRPAHFGIVEAVGRYCTWYDGVFIYESGEGTLYLSCELPLCQNGDRIEVGSLYETCEGVVEVIRMNLTNRPNQTFIYTVMDGDYNIETLLAYEFYSIFW